MALTFAVAQLNFVVGDLMGNAQKIVTAAKEAHAQGADVVLTPELALCGYAAEDLLLRPSFIQACDDALKFIQTSLAEFKGLHVVVGHPAGDGRRERSVSETRRLNMATVLCEGRAIASYAKRHLPNYQVFDERRYFLPGEQVCVFEVKGHSVGLLICEDAWFEQPALDCQRAGAQVLAVLNASPFHVGKGGERERAMGERCQSVRLPMVYAHLVGGQDEVIFEGRSFVMNADGVVQGRAQGFVESVFLARLENRNWSSSLVDAGTTESDLWHALVLGVRDYIGKNGFPGAILGLSGGIDSALVLAVAVDALGPDRVRTVMMPSAFTAEISWVDAKDMAKRMGVRYQEISILPMVQAFEQALAEDFKGLPLDATEENIQARSRGTLLMALSNKTGSIVLTTGNKSEMATGYCTLYGDMAGGFAVIKDVFKTMVFRLARWRNANDPYGRGANPIPERIITRPPSAELRPDQTDQDSLPPYEVLDEILALYMEEDESAEQIVAKGHERAVVEQVTRLLRINEYKRRQSPVGIRVSHRSFGKDWRYPITNRYRG
ncbi:MAG: hypothetical protein RL307_263 [Pseudomonadota bacterium]